MWTDKGKERWSLVMARAWAEPAFMDRLVREPAAVLSEYSIQFPADTELKVVVRTKNKQGKVDYIPFMSKEDASELSDRQLDAVAGGAGGSSRLRSPVGLPPLDLSQHEC